MSEKNYINFHCLISHSPSCLNRDDMNMQKTAVFGGKRRIRISSQSLKRTMRHSDYYKKNVSQPSDRTRELGSLLKIYTEKLADQFDQEIIGEVVKLISGVKEIAEDTKAGAVAPWAVNEVARYCQIYEKLKDENSDEKEFEKAWKKILKSADDFKTALADSADIALSGRMATSGIMTSVDASFALAHAITTHTVSGDIDWFTAVDDLIVDSGETGSGHLDTQEFSAGVFYRYGSLNIRQLQENLGGASREDVLKLAKHLLHLLCTEVPSAKQNSFAAFNHADFAFVSFGDMPISLANAFEEPVKQGRLGGFLVPSIEEFCSYQKKMYEGYGLDDKTAWFSLRDCSLEKGRKKSLADLEKWVALDGGAG
ncbi:MAG: type I-E CRISPR-associated protein Cas7/Cse4/CasC [Thermodesulfobacteriota bacterium]|nr:type I-E CRISPR-associated protein Cas7/Cse4/CasC [Thermodesulfobacteriota bacterium]